MKLKSKSIIIFVGIVIVLIAIYLISTTNISDYLFSNIPLKVDSKNLEETILTPYLEQDIKVGDNLLFCSTFQLAWNELKNDIVKENIQLEGNPPLVEYLNAGLITKEDIAEDSYVAMAGFAKDDILKKINNALRTKFPDVVPTVKEDFQRPDDILAYAFLYKNLKFEHSFELLKEPIPFNSRDKTVNVKSFGINKYSEKRHEDISKQVEIFDYNSNTDFIIRLTSKFFEDDEIILAKIQPERTLLKTIQTVEKRIKNNKPVHLRSFSTLQIPKINLNITHSYSELMNKYFKNKGYEDYFIGKAQQDILFKIDEKGAILISEAKILAGRGVSIPKQLIFDQPFLIYLKEKDGKYPYFAIWIDNAELMIKE